MEILKIIDLNKIEEFTNCILKEYEKYKFLQQKNEKLFFYPENDHNLISENINNIKELILANSTNSSILKECDKLLFNLGVYIDIIKKSSFGNDIFSKIILNVIYLKNLKLKACAIISGMPDKIESDDENPFDAYNSNQNMNENHLNFSKFYI